MFQMQSGNNESIANNISNMDNRIQHHQQIAQMLQQHLQNKMEKGPMFVNEPNQVLCYFNLNYCILEYVLVL